MDFANKDSAGRVAMLLGAHSPSHNSHNPKGLFLVADTNQSEVVATFPICVRLLEITYT